MSRVRRPHDPTGGALAVLAVVGALVVGCSSGSDAPAASPTASITAPITAPITAKDAMTDDPAQALAIAGMTLPPAAQQASVEHKEIPGYHFAYTVTFTAARSQVDDFVGRATGAATGMLAVMPAGPAGELLSDTTVTAVPAGSRFAATSFHADHGYGNLIVLVDGPDLTTVHVGIAGFPS
jgi:hypothetical protein